MRRFSLLAVGVALLIMGMLVHPIWHLARTALHDTGHREPTPTGYADDASWLNRTPIAETFRVPENADSAERQLAALLIRARQSHLHVSIAGARHSMGGHTISRNGLVIDMTPFHGMVLNADSTTVTVRAGTRWAELVPFLDRHGRSVAVMQSNNDFTIGGTLSVNAHGWQADHAPIASTVRSMRVLLADGRIVRCSRAAQRELFSLVLGGYGLFGIILDVELETVPNARYRIDRYHTTSTKYATLFAKEVTHGRDVGMAYGRLAVSQEGFLQDAILTVFRNAPSRDGSLPTLTPLGPSGLARTVFRGSVGSAYGKSLRWTLEERLGTLPGIRVVSRNQLLNEPSAFFEDRSSHSTDILHEYFIPESRLEDFLVQARRIIPAHHADLLNVTIRNVLPDTDTALPYARERVFGLVMYFNQPRTRVADDSARAMTRDLVDAALSVGGTYYLPYRLHPTPAQFERAYPSARRFFALKARYDPDTLFRNGFYDSYASAPNGR